jgi:hypothetical protein
VRRGPRRGGSRGRNGPAAEDIAEKPRRGPSGRSARRCWFSSAAPAARRSSGKVRRRKRRGGPRSWREEVSGPKLFAPGYRRLVPEISTFVTISDHFVPRAFRTGNKTDVRCVYIDVEGNARRRQRPTGRPQAGAGTELIPTFRRPPGHIRDKVREPTDDSRKMPASFSQMPTLPCLRHAIITRGTEKSVPLGLSGRIAHGASTRTAALLQAGGGTPGGPAASRRAGSPSGRKGRSRRGRRARGGRGSSR